MNSFQLAAIKSLSTSPSTPRMLVLAFRIYHKFGKNPFLGVRYPGQRHGVCDPYFEANWPKSKQRQQAQDLKELHKAVESARHGNLVFVYESLRTGPRACITVQHCEDAIKVTFHRERGPGDSGEERFMCIL